MKFNLSEITDVIRNRRTIPPEKFSGRKVHKEIVSNILNNAIWAPSHGMTQPWRFKVFMGEGLTKFGQFQAEHYKEITPTEKFMQSKYDKLISRADSASVCIAICMKREVEERIPEIEEIEAVACAVQNMYLTCTAYGLGAFWGTGGVTYTEGMKLFLGIGEKDKCLGLFYLGYPEGEWPKGQRKPIEYITEWIEE